VEIKENKTRNSPKQFTRNSLQFVPKENEETSEDSSTDDEKASEESK
jgi:hypothetical protein